MDGFHRTTSARSDTPVAPPGGVCDACDARLDRSDAYYLSTTTVLLSVPFWTKLLLAADRVNGGLGLTTRERLSSLSRLLITYSARSAPWAICEECSEMFAFERDRARTYARDRTDPPDTGPVDPHGCVAFAAQAWERLMGVWPANVAPIPVDEFCDLCEAAIYLTGEPAMYLTAEHRRALRAAGVIDAGPERPRRAQPTATGRWRLCLACTARLNTRASRAQVELG